MKESSIPCYPNSDMLVTKLKTQGFFDKVRKMCLENVENNSDYVYVKHNVVDKIVSKFLANKFTNSNKLELRDQLRRRLQNDASFQRSLRQMSGLLLTTQVSPESLAPSINQVACEALNVDYHEWLRMSQKHQNCKSTPDKSGSPVEHTDNSAPLLPNPSLLPVVEEPLLPTSAVTQDLQSSVVLPENRELLPDENDVEMEVDDGGDEMEVESADSNIGTNIFQTQCTSKYPSTNSNVSENIPCNNIGLTASSYENKSGLSVSPAFMTNSSSFSRKISVAAAAGWTTVMTAEQLDAVSDNEMTGGYSPLRRRMSLTGNSAKHSSPPAHSSYKPSFEGAASTLLEKRRMPPSPSRYRSRVQNYGSSSRHGDNSIKCGSQRQDRDRYYDKKQRRDNKSYRYRESSRYRKDGDRHVNSSFGRCAYASQLHSTGESRSGYSRRNRYTSSAHSRSCSKGLSRSQSPVPARRQRQASPHSTHTPDIHISNSHLHRRPHPPRVRRDSPHSHEYEQHHRERERRSCQRPDSSSSYLSPAVGVGHLVHHHLHRPHPSPLSSAPSPSLFTSRRSNSSTPLATSRAPGYPFHGCQ